jgi:hypothetical protein
LQGGVQIQFQQQVQCGLSAITQSLQTKIDKTFPPKF